MSDPPPPPGWYPDPAGGPGARFWDGRTWTADVWAAAVRPARSVSDLIDGERRISSWAQTAAAVYLSVAMATALFDFQEADCLRRLVDWYRQLARNIGTPGYVAPHPPTLVSPWISLLSLVGIPCFVVLLVWQYRAASAARALGRPATHGPGWGVGSWFVPVVSLWMPFQALRDCLPPGHPRRRVPWLLLAGGIGGGVLNVGAVAALAYARPLGDVLVVAAVLVYAGLIPVMVTYVRAVGETNRAPAPTPG